MFFKDKIKLVKEHLPEEFRNVEAYKILSIDIHTHDEVEIDSEQMGVRFDLVYKVIEYILNELVINESRAKEKKSMQFQLSRFLNELN